MVSDHELRVRLAFRVTTDEMRSFVRDELPDLYPHLPGDTCSPAHLASRMFELADQHFGGSAVLRARLRQRWPGLLGVVIAPPSPSLAARVFALVVLALSQPQRSEAASSLPAPGEPVGPGETDDGSEQETTGPMTGPDGATDGAGATTGGQEPAATTDGQATGGEESSGGPDVIRRPPPPRPLSSVRGAVERALRACTDGEEWDLEIVVATDGQGRWSEAYGERLSAQMSRCVDGALGKVRRKHRATRYPAGARQNFVFHLR